MKKIIRSKKEVVLDSRKADSGIVYVKFSHLTLSEKTLKKTINIVDYKSEIIPIDVIDDNGSLVSIEQEFLTKITSKIVEVNKDEVDKIEQQAIEMGLFEKSGITTTDLYNLIIASIYLKIITDSGDNGKLIYDTVVTDWEIIDDIY